MNFKTNFKIPFVNRTVAFMFSTNRAFNLSFKFIGIETPTHQTGGMTSYCPDSKHILLFDYDSSAFEEVITELRILQDFYKLSAIYIFENNKEDSWHAVCLSKFSLYDAVEIIAQTSTDRAFQRRPLKYGLRRWVLRTEPKGKSDREKPCYIGKLNSNYKKHGISTAHKLFLEVNYNIPIEKTVLDDHNTNLDYFSYKTARL